MKLPSSIDIARSIIKRNPELFTDHYLCEVIISKALRDYYEQCRDYVGANQPTILEIHKQLKSLNNLIK